MTALIPIPCMRCGRMLTSYESIVRGYGVKCAYLAALGKLSRTQADQRKASIGFHRLDDGHYGILRGLDAATEGPYIGHLKRGKTGLWSIIVWGDRVDVDADFHNAKVRASRIFWNMGY